MLSHRDIIMLELAEEIKLASSTLIRFLSGQTVLPKEDSLMRYYIYLGQYFS